MRDLRGQEPVDVERLAVFPELNPNLVIEIGLDGRVLYMNPVAHSRFPDMVDLDDAHQLLAGVLGFVKEFRRRGLDFAGRVVQVDDAWFEQKVCFTPSSTGGSIRLYAHDITALTNAERQITELARRVVHTQEEERHRVARELHDEAGQALAALKISLQLLADDAPADMRSNLADVVALVESTREGIRRLAHGLRPPALDALGLDRAIAQFCEETQDRTHLTVTYLGRPVESLTDEEEVSLYRFVQEALTNTVLHAQARRAVVRLGKRGEEILLSVSDDGIGMDPAILRDPARAGLGIVGMRERLELLAGRLEVHNSPTGGLEMVAVLPDRSAS